MESTCKFEKLNDVLDLYRNIGIITSPESTSSSQFRDQVSCSFRPKVALLDSCGPRRTSNPRFLKNTSPCPVGIEPDAVALSIYSLKPSRTSDHCLLDAKNSVRSRHVASRNTR